jgi:hypothetical protein
MDDSADSILGKTDNVLFLERAQLRGMASDSIWSRATAKGAGWTTSIRAR